MRDPALRPPRDAHALPRGTADARRQWSWIGKAAAGVALLCACTGRAADFDPARAGLDELLFHAQRYATTEGKAERKKAAREELFDRGTNTLRYLMGQIHLSNLWIRVLADELVGRLEPEEAAPILLESLDGGTDSARRHAVYFLGKHDTPQYADRLLPLLDDPELAAGAARTLAKWKFRAALPGAAAVLKSGKEPRRVTAANALRDLDDPAAIGPLIEALEDPVFTVRKTAARALAALGPDAERAMLRALPTAEGAARRELIRALGAMNSRPAVPSLRRLLRDPDWGTRADAARALRSIDPRRAPAWIRRAGASGLMCHDGMRLTPPANPLPGSGGTAGRQE